MTPLIQQNIQQAIQHLQGGSHSQAENLLMRVLKIEPNNLPALEILGLIKASNNDYAEAIKHLKKAVKINSQNPATLYNLAKALSDNNNHAESIPIYEKAMQLNRNNISCLLGYATSLARLEKFDKAFAVYDEALAANENLIEVWANKALIYTELNRYEEALFSCEKALNLDPSDFKMLLHKGKNLFALNRFDEALYFFDQALNIQPDSAEILIQKAFAFQALNKTELSLHAYSKAIEMQPDYTDAFIGRGNIFMQLQEHGKALVEYEKVISISPDDSKIHSNKGVALEKLNRFKEASESFEKAIDLDPKNIGAYLNNSRVIKAMGNIDASFALLERAVKIDPMCAEAHYEMGAIALKQMSFDLGWEKYEWRWKLNSQPLSRLPDKPFWNGVSSDGRLLIAAEQGIGDQVLFSSVFNELDGLNQKITISLEKKLIPIYERSFPEFEFIDVEKSITGDAVDKYIPIGSLAKNFRRNVDDFKKTKFPYLICNAQLSNELRSQLQNPKKIICGVACNSTNRMLGNDKNFPLTALLPLLQLNQFTFVNLQHGDAGSQLQELARSNNTQIHHFSNIDLFEDLDSTISLVNACDLVVTSSNSIAHLAGAIGKRTILILPFETGRFWYWHEIDNHSLWYPSIRIFNQKTQGHWGGVMSEVTEFMGEICVE